MGMSEPELEIVKTIIYHAKQDSKSFDELMWFIHSDEVRILIQQIMSLKE